MSHQGPQSTKRMGLSSVAEKPQYVASEHKLLFLFWEPQKTDFVELYT